MSLDNVQLPESVLQGLYNKSLYTSKSNESKEKSVENSNISFLGDNCKKITVIVSSTEAIYLPDDELNFLLGILNACNLSMADVALVNVHKNASANYTDITDQLKAEKIFLFGLDSDRISLPLQFPNYQIQKFNNQMYLSSQSLKALQGDKEEKLKLWNCLKKIFLPA